MAKTCRLPQPCLDCLVMWKTVQLGCSTVMLGMQCWHLPASVIMLRHACQISKMERCKWGEGAHLELHVGPMEVIVICILEALHGAAEVVRVVLQLMLQHTKAHISASF